MKGFIEVRDQNDKLILVNVNKIYSVCGSLIRMVDGSTLYNVKEDYETIKKMIEASRRWLW